MWGFSLIFLAFFALAGNDSESIPSAPQGELIEGVAVGAKKEEPGEARAEKESAADEKYYDRLADELARAGLGLTIFGSAATAASFIPESSDPIADIFRIAGLSLAGAGAAIATSGCVMAFRKDFKK